MDACDHLPFDITDEHIRRAQQGYFANISDVDDKIGKILDVLERTPVAKNTVILFVSDHRDMLGERSLRFKMNFFEGSARVPMQFPQRVRLRSNEGGGHISPPLQSPGIDMGPAKSGHSSIEEARSGYRFTKFIVSRSFQRQQPEIGITSLLHSKAVKRSVRLHDVREERLGIRCMAQNIKVTCLGSDAQRRPARNARIISR